MGRGLRRGGSGRCGRWNEVVKEDREESSGEDVLWVKDGGG